MSVNSTVTVLSHGQSWCVTLFDLSHNSFGIGLWESGVVSSNMVSERSESSFQTQHICVTLVKDVTRTTYFMVGSRMLEKAKQIWSLSDGETNYEELSPGDKRCLY